MDTMKASDSVPTGSQDLYRRLALLVTRAGAMGLLPAERVRSLDADSLRRVFDALQREGLFSIATLDVELLLRVGPAGLDAEEARRSQAKIGQLIDALEESPVPASEWGAMRSLFGDEALARLVSVSESSVRRYASATRSTPQDVAERLHWLAMVVADLAGAYNEFGIRRWFERPRAQLDGRTPREALKDDWRIDDETAIRVRALASVLTGAQSLAA